MVQLDRRPTGEKIVGLGLTLLTLLLLVAETLVHPLITPRLDAAAAMFLRPGSTSPPSALIDLHCLLVKSCISYEILLLKLPSLNLLSTPALESRAH